MVNIYIILVNGSMRIILKGIDYISSLMTKYKINNAIMMVKYEIDRENISMFHGIIKNVEDSIGISVNRDDKCCLHASSNWTHLKYDIDCHKE